MHASHASNEHDAYGIFFSLHPIFSLFRKFEGYSIQAITKIKGPFDMDSEVIRPPDLMTDIIL